MQAEERRRFEELVLPHLGAALNLARWILGNRADAEDVTQDAVLRAVRFFSGFAGGDARAWLLQIVRNSCYTWLQKKRPAELAVEFDEELYPTSSGSPETLAVQADERDRLQVALESLPPRAREILVLRELEGCSYREIAQITGVPIGTVMSNLSRGRERLQRAMTTAAGKEAR